MAYENNQIVGASGVLLLGYTLLLIGIHMFIPHPSATKKIITLSYTSLTLLTLAQASIVGTYWVPHIQGVCICSELWSTALISYVLGLYALKFIYIERVEMLNKHPMLASERVNKWIRILKYSLYASCLTCVTMMIVLTDGECHNDVEAYGCKPTFHVASVWLAIVMIFFDGLLFLGFCWKWWSLIKVFADATSSDNKIVIEMVQSFGIQFILTIVAMISCVIDGIVNLWMSDYSTLIIFCFDSAVIASCNFAMIKESQAFMWKYLCWPCKIPSFLIKDRFNVADKSTDEPTASFTTKTRIEGTDTRKTEKSDVVINKPEVVSPSAVSPAITPSMQPVATESNLYKDVVQIESSSV